MSIEKVKCPVMNRRSTEEARGYSSPVFANYDVLVRFSELSEDNPIGIICPDYKDNACSHTTEECVYLSGWKTKKSANR